ncbi:response regulator transcription factor [Gallaecimonas kandeliae]|uniref:response regulator transcription factor n=1 Tax=Gallaecimonas kandeliae TaxID=3029055 RepID=UPI0026473C0F|nr:response regulator transcription factor [Gallaecimonas kandeliae]WKE67010.1 response regulator transcription factor [Gallaecimonas kandeliae]
MNSHHHLLLVEDDEALGTLIKRYLTQHRFLVSHAKTGQEAMQHCHGNRYDLILCDIMLPDMDGFELWSKLEGTVESDFIFLTSLKSIRDQIRGLELGACDYIVKPVAPELLLAKLKAVLRRRSALEKSKIVLHDLCMESASQTLTIGGRPYDLTPREFDLLWLFAAYPGQILSRDYLFIHYIGRQYDGLDRAVDLNVSRLRKTLESMDVPGLELKTVHGKGYLLSYPPQWEGAQA